MNKLIWIIALAVVLVGGYLLLSGPRVTSEEQILADVGYLLDDSVQIEISDALSDAILASVLDKEALAAEASQLNNLPSAEPISGLDQYMKEASQ